jgi:hypothetical protein
MSADVRRCVGDGPLKVVGSNDSVDRALDPCLRKRVQGLPTTSARASCDARSKTAQHRTGRPGCGHR